MNDVAPEISVVIPVYNAQSCIEKLIETLQQNLKNYSYEIILVDDNSLDNTWQLIKVLKQQHSFIKAFRLSRNYGQQKATFCGLTNAVGNIVITIDDDLSHPIDKLTELINVFKSAQTDMMYVTPSKYHYPWYRKLLSNIYKRISRYENPDAGKGSSFRIMSQELANSITEHASHLIVIDEIILWYIQKIHAVYYDFYPSQKQSSTYTYRGLFGLSKTTLMISTTMPLVIVKTIGFSVATGSFLMGIVYLVKKFVFHYAEKGYTSIIVSILFGVGLILLSLGIIGEYIAYILMGIHKKPPYHIKEKL